MSVVGPDLVIANGAGQGPGGPGNHLAVAQGQRLYLGASGGTLLLSPPGAAPGSMSLTDMQNRTWHLLREDGPDTGYAAPTTGDFNITVVTRDLNIAMAQFISQTGIAPKLTERMDNFPVYPVLDYPLPPGLVSLTRVEYTPAGQQQYKLQPKSFNEWDNVFGTVLPNDTGQPYYYREPFAGMIRLQPQPYTGNYQGYGYGTITFTGTPAAGQVVTVFMINGTTSTVSVAYTTLYSDTINTVPQNVATLINNSAAVNGTNAFLQAATSSSNQLTLTANSTPGTTLQYYVTVTGTSMAASPGAATYFTAQQDVITFYYSSLGTLLINPLDVPALPPQFHMAPVYRVLADYWARKQDFNQSKHYLEMFGADVVRGKSYTFDMDRASSPNMDGDNYAETWPEGGG